jgi:RHS repeat-associated protein
MQAMYNYNVNTIFTETLTSNYSCKNTGNYSFSAKEKDEESGLSYFGARYYDSELGIFISRDPLFEKYPHVSPYTYCLNNPLRYTDPTGMEVDDYVFNQNGDFLRVDKNDKPDRLVIENSKTGARQSYQFADPVNDPKDIANGTINKVEFVSSEQVANFLSDAGAFNPTNRENEWSYLKTESKGGKALDFSYSQIPFAYPDASMDPLITPSPVLFIPEGDGYAHNHMNFGNFLWGAAGHSLGFSETTLKLGAHFNSVFNSRTNGYGGQLDSKDDQFSIIRGVNFSKTHKFRNR